MAHNDTVIALYQVAAEAHALQERVEQMPASRSRFAVHDSHIRPAEVGHAANTLRISRRDYYSLFPRGKGDDSYRFLAEKLADLRQVRLAGLLVPDMGARDVDEPLFHQRQGV